MSESVNLPALGESVTEGTVTRWLKKVGDRIEVDEPLVEVSTDKVDTEIPSPVSGVLEAILVAEDETVEVGTALATVGDGSGGGAAPAAPAEQAPEAAAPAAPAAGSPAPEAPEAQAPAPEAQPPASQWEPIPAQPEPAQPAAQQPAPEQPAPEQAAPEQAAPEQPAPEQPAPEQPAPEQPAPESPVSEQPAPEQQPVAEEAADAPAAAPTPGTVAATAPDQAPAQPAPAQEAPAAPAPTAPAAPAAPAGNAGYVTPLVRKLAQDSGIDLSTIQGSGIGGRIRKQDVLSVASGTSAPAARKPLETSPLRGTTVPMSRLRKVVAERAVVSMQTSAQLTTVVEVDVTAVATLRDELKADFQKKTGTKLTFLPFFTLAAAEALKAFPIVNATIDGESIVYPAQENVSIAVDTERGLLTPVIRNASDLSIADLAREIADLAERTRENRLKPDELAGGTFTVTNTGSRGALFDTPVVFLPQSAILGTGIVTKKPVVVTDNGLDAIAIRSVAFLALSYDHRIVDGADAARFLVAVKERLEAGDFRGNLGLD